MDNPDPAHSESDRRVPGFRSRSKLRAISFRSKTLKAVTWNIAMIGEAAGQVPEAVHSMHPEVPWADMRGNQIVHGYDSIDFEIVWEVVQRELPPLVPLLEEICREKEG